MIETSARHVHVTQEVLDKLFGEGYALTPVKELSQPGQFACAEKVLITGPKGKLKARIIGPARAVTQVELSATDARALGIAAPVCESGKTDDTPGCTLTGPAGEMEITQGCIIAQRHIHMTPADAARFGVADKQVVQVKYAEGCRPIVYDGVLVRVKETFLLAMHIDVDEANAGGISCSQTKSPVGEIIA
ncbi:MAG: phosphate propanoyltransferase [Oscillospiraceae bacterium]|nr:phosphate propanoyltransferase [Oscillospiraceae bacterium]